MCDATNPKLWTFSKPLKKNCTKTLNKKIAFPAYVFLCLFVRHLKKVQRDDDKKVHAHFVTALQLDQKNNNWWQSSQTNTTLL